MKNFTLIALLLSLFSWQVNAQISTFPYVEDFESGAGGWTTPGAVWELGTPANTVINSAAGGVNAWATQLTGDYPASANEAVVSPVFDFSALYAPQITMSVWWESEFSWDGAVLQSSTDGGTTWQNVGAFGDPNNWYNDNTINAAPGAQQEGWTGRNSSSNGSGGWVVASNTLDGLAGQPSVQLRVIFASDGSVQDEGFAFDEITISNASTVTSFPYNADFEGGDFGWTAPGAVWELGTPSAPTINSAASGTNAWATILAGSYPPSSDESVVSPTFDFTGVPSPAISFSVWHESESGWDGTALQASTDGGATWNNVGNVGDPNNWHNEAGLFSNVGGQNDGWSGSSGGWVTASNDLTGLGGQSNVLLRFAFGSDASVNLDGFAFDDVTVFNVDCAQPIALGVANVTGTTVDLVWTEANVATVWNIEWGAPGFVLGTGTQITGTTSNPQPLTGLTEGTAYEFYVQADCGGGLTSAWSGPFTFNTTCNITTPAVLPWIETFEAVTDTTVLGGGILHCEPTHNWNFASADPTGRVRFGTDAITAFTGTGAATLDLDVIGGFIANEMILTIDLSAYAASPELAMSFDWMHHGEEDHPGDRVWVRGSDTDPWVEVFDFTPITVTQLPSGQWRNEPIVDIMTPLTAAGQTPSATFQVRFGQEDDFPATSLTASDGLTVDNVALFVCLPAQDVTVIDSDTTSAAFSWLSGASEWIIEYGPAGFTPGTGDTVITTSNPDTLTNLIPDTYYEFYITAVCGAGDTSTVSGPTPFNTFDQGLYMEADNACPPAGFIDIAATGVNLNIPYNGEATIDPTPFDILFQGQQITSLTVGNHGGLQLGGTAGTNIPAGGNFNTLPDGTLFAWGDLLDEETGDIFWQQIGTSPNSVLVFQWNNINNAFGTTPTVTFQIQIDEATNEIYYVYDDVVFGGTNAADDFGANADIGVAGPNQDITTSQNDPTYLQENSCAHYYYTDCPRPANYAVTFTTNDQAALTWNAGLSNETEWQVIYGLEGFDPLTGGTSVTVNTGSAIIIPGLDDKEVYDVYILALCANGDTSVALTGQFETLPNCADPTALAGSTAIDSIFATWAYTNNTGFPIQEFGFEYGPNGYMNGMGTTQYGVDTVSFSDTIADPNLMSGGLYDVYVQAVCQTGDTSNWVGPITVTMPLTNDSTCLAQAIPVDGVAYSFNGTGAGISPGETNIAPPAGPCDGQMTWCNSSMTATTWFTFVAPASGNVRIDGEFQDFDGQVAVYSTSDCANFNVYNMLGANDDTNLSGDDYPTLNLCGLTPGNTYYLVHDPNGPAGIYSLRLREIVVEAGTDNGLLDVCLGDTVNLDTQLTGADAGGTWTEDIATAGFNAPFWASTGLASQVYTFEYTVVDGCATDSVMTSVEVYGPSFAGNDGTITACQNEPINLLEGLVGGTGIDLTGTWYDPSNNALPSGEIITGSIPGQFNYDYIAGNGVCPDDTANVVLTVDPNCDFLNLQDITFEGMDIYPNPTTNVFYIANEGSSEVYNYELTDLNGKVITTKEAAINGVETTEVNVEDLETGVYLIRIFNENAEKTFRVVKQ